MKTKTIYLSREIRQWIYLGATATALLAPYVKEQYQKIKKNKKHEKRKEFVATQIVSLNDIDASYLENKIASSVGLKVLRFNRTKWDYVKDRYSLLNSTFENSENGVYYATFNDEKYYIIVE